MKNYLLAVIAFIPLLLNAQNPKTEFYRHLRYNHVSPVIDLALIHPIDQEVAQTESHYKVIKDQKGRIVELLNNHFQTEKKHPLASVGVYKMLIIYDGNTESRIYYDIKGRRIQNDRGVYKEIYTSNDKGDLITLDFFDIDNSRIESNWNITKYEWKYQDSMIIERRYNLDGQMVNLSSYFDFGITGVVLDDSGVPSIHYNLDDDLKVVENQLGIASYRDIYDELGNHVEYSYHDLNGNLTNSPWKFARATKRYDQLGNQIGMARYDTTNALLFERDIPNNINVELASPLPISDSMEIKRISEGYLIALQKMDPILMEEVMSDSLNKVTIGYDRNLRKEYPRATTYHQMIAFAKDWNKANNKFPFKPSNEVEILDIYNRMASVKLVSDNWVEYLHLIKLDGKWEIINLIWQHKDIRRYPK